MGINKYVCPQCGEEFDTLCTVSKIDFDLECEDCNKEYFECPECGYRDQQNVFID